MSTDDHTAAELFQLDRRTCLTLLTTQHVGRLWMGGDEEAVLPVNYAVVDGGIMFRTDPSTRAGRSPGERVMFEVDMFDDRTRSGWSVVVHGDLFVAADRQDPPDIDTWAPGQRDRWMTVSVHAVTGRLLRGAVDRSSHRAGGYL